MKRNETCPNCGAFRVYEVKAHLGENVRVSLTDPEHTAICNNRVEIEKSVMFREKRPKAQEIDNDGKVRCGAEWKPLVS